MSDFWRNFAFLSLWDAARKTERTTITFRFIPDGEESEPEPEKPIVTVQRWMGRHPALTLFLILLVIGSLIQLFEKITGVKISK